MRPLPIAKKPGWWWRIGRKKAGAEDPVRGKVNNWIDIRTQNMHFVEDSFFGQPRK
jgi:hypothetical protein